MSGNDKEFFTIVDEYDDVKDFLDEVEEKHEEIETALLALEKDSFNVELLNQVFRALHTVKGDAKIFHIEPMVDFTHSVESLVEALREGRFEYCKKISEIILLSIDRLQMMTRDVATVGKTRVGDLEDIEKSICGLVAIGKDGLEDMSPKIMRLLSGNKPNPKDVAKVEKKVKQSSTQQKKSAGDISDVPEIKPNSIFSLPETLDPDLQFFRSLGEEVDKGQVRWEGRTAFIAAIALGMNGVAGKPVDYFQLEAAVYLHDIGMGFIPDSIMNKEGKLTLEELSQIREHPDISSGILHRMMGWDPAVEMIIHHHERYDGKGYPNKLVGDNICHGGRIMAICDSFYAMTHQRPDRVNKKSILRAVTEINACVGSQFCPYWVEQFNKVIKIQHEAGAFAGYE
ncbi:MAG: HD domain-containing protein [Gammaproteobacteria bacterium]|nr:MAG: HD domain-containing protein [Gammaproteobacteria bacterium]